MISKLQVWSFVIYILSIPFQNILSIGFLGGTLTKYLGLLLIVLTLSEMLLNKKVYFSTYFVYYILFGVHILFVALASAYPEESLKWIVQFFQLSLLYIIISLKSYTKKDYSIIITSIIISGMIVSFYIFYNMSQGITTEQERISIASGDRNSDPNHVAASMLFPLILLFQCRTNIILKISSILVMLFGLLLTGSRGALIGLACGFVYLFFYAKTPLKTKVINALLALVASSIVFVFLLPLLPSAISERFSLDLLISTGGSGRANLWMDAISMFLQKPLWGHGYSLYMSMSLYENAAHNIYIQLLVETGIIGLSLFVAFIASIIQISKTNNKLAGTIAVLVASTFLGTLGYPYFWLAIFVPMIRVIEDEEGEVNNFEKEIFRKDQSVACN